MLELTNGTETQISFNITRAFPPVQLTDIQWSFVHISNSTSVSDTEITLDPTCTVVAANCTDERYLRYNFSSDLLTLTIYSVRVADYGLFVLTATNPAGINTMYSNLTIEGAILLTL